MNFKILHDKGRPSPGTDILIGVSGKGYKRRGLSFSLPPSGAKRNVQSI